MFQLFLGAKEFFWKIVWKHSRLKASLIFFIFSSSELSYLQMINILLLVFQVQSSIFYPGQCHFQLHRSKNFCIPVNYSHHYHCFWLNDRFDLQQFFCRSILHLHLTNIFESNCVSRNWASGELLLWTWFLDAIASVQMALAQSQLF